MSFFPRTRLCHSPEPIVTPMDEMTTANWESGSSGAAIAMPMAIPADDPELHYPFYHQRGRRRRRSPPAVPPYDGLPVPFSLAMTTAIGNTSHHQYGEQSYQRPNHPHHAPRPRHHPRLRQQTPSGSSGTFRGRRRHRSPSLGATAAVTAAAAAIRKASSQPHTRSSSMASSMRHVSRPSSPHEWRGTNSWLHRSVSRSRGGGGGSGSGRGLESPSPRRRMAFRASTGMDHGMVHYHNHHLLQPRHYTKPVSRRSHCPSRSGSAEGYNEDAGIMRVDDGGSSAHLATMATRRRRRRQRTQSRPRPHRVISGESIAGGSGSGVYGLPSYYTFDDGSAVHAAATANELGETSATATTASSRLQFQMLLAESSDSTSDGDAMDVEMG